MKDIIRQRESKTVQRTVRLPRGIDEALLKMAVPKGVSVPHAIVQILTHWLERHAKKCVKHHLED